MSKSLLGLYTKEQPWVNCPHCSSKRATFFVCFCACRISLLFPSLMSKSESLPSLFAQLLFFKEWREQIAPVALYKRATISDSLPLLFSKERLAGFTLFHEWIAFSLFHSQKTRNWLEKMKSEFPTLTTSYLAISLVLDKLNSHWGMRMQAFSFS